MIAKPLPDIQEITKATQYIIGYGSGRVVEVRAPETPYGTWSGYYTQKKLIDDVFKASSDETTTRNVYWTIQEIGQELKNAADNTLRPHTAKTTNDTEIHRYIWLPIDCDPIRPDKVSSTDAEKALALEVATKIRAFLRGLNIQSILADSGNGYHVLVRLDILNQNGTKDLIKEVLFAFNARFNTAAINVDTSVHNPSRILKIYGTVSRKGEHTADRPHRVSRLLEVPENPAPLSEEQVKALLAELLKGLSPESVTKAKAQKVERNERNLIPHGSMYGPLMSEAGSLWRRGYDLEGVETALIAWADANCEPPIDYDKVKQYAKGNQWERGNPMANTVLINGRIAGSGDGQIIAPSSSEGECTVLEAELPMFPQMIGPLHDLSIALFPDIPYEYKVMAAFTHYGLLRSGLDVLDTDPNLQSRLYCCLIGDPQRGKSAALNEVRKVFQQLTSRYNCITSVDSGPALVDEFSDRHKAAILQDDKLARVLIDCDEMKGLFEKSKVTTQSRNSMFDEFLKLYESNRTGNRSRKAGKTHVDDAHLAILGGATPEGYQTMWTGSAGGSTGLQSRFIGVSTNAPRMPIERRPCSDGLGSIVVKLYDQMAKPKRVVNMEWDAIGELTEWWQDVPTDNPATNRIDDMVKRLCLIMASSSESDVTYDIMKSAIKAGQYFIAFREKYNPPDSSSYIQALENEILKIAFKNSGKSLSANQFRRAIHPERKPGGLGAFLVAWRNVIGSGMLVVDGVNRKGQPLYKLGEN